MSMSTSKKIKDLTGKRFDRLIVIERAEDKEYSCGKKAIMWKCQCDCGNTVIRSSGTLSCNSSHSCGCKQKEILKKAIYRHGKVKHRLYGVYYAMISRCYRKNDKRYKTYGARGVTVCDEWLGKDGFVNFIKWAESVGWDEEKNGRTQQSLDRIDNNKGYSPENCKFSTSLEQAQHTTRSHYLTFNGETHTLSEWDRMCGFPNGVILQRIRVCKKTVKEAITNPLRVNVNGHYVYVDSLVQKNE